MKKILPLFLICLVYELKAQTLITFDYNSRAYIPTDNTCVTQGSSVSYRIVNINTFAKKVLISGSLFSLNTDMPSEIATLFRIKIDNADKNLADTKEQVEKMNNVSSEAKESAKKAAAPALTTAAIEDSKSAATEAEKLVADCRDYYRKAEKIKDAITFQKNLAETLSNENYYNEVSMAQALNNRGVNTATVNALEADFINFNSAYDKVYAQYEVAADAARDAKNATHQAKIESAQEQVEEDYEALKKQYQDALTSIDNLFTKATDPVSYIVTSQHPIYVEDDADEVEFQVQIGDPKDDFSKINPFKKILKVKGGIKLDYSVGLALKFISDDQYFLDSDKKIQQRSKNNALTPGIAPMLHVYRRTCNTIAWGGMFGINADFKELTDVNLGFLGGLSVIVGRSQKIIFSAGLSYSKVSRLKAAEFDVNNKAYDNTDFTIENVTERILQPSGFFSFSYSLAKRNVKK